MNKVDVMSLALEAGAKILEYGGETYRVEDTIRRILIGFGIKDAESFVTPTGIVISGTDIRGNTLSKVKRIPTLKIDLEKISLINNLSRQIETGNISPEDFKVELNKILARKPYPLWLDALSAGLVAGSFTVFFGGSFFDGLSGFIAGLAVFLTGLLVKALNLSSFFQNAFGGSISVFIAYLFTFFNIAKSPETIIIGSIMLLVPGITMTNGIRDTFQGDYLSGVTRATEALITAVGIAFGTALAFLLLKNLGAINL